MVITHQQPYSVDSWKRTHFNGSWIVTSYFASISKATITTEQQLLKGTKEYSGKGHYIIVGWNERQRKLLKKSMKENMNLPSS